MNRNRIVPVATLFLAALGGCIDTTVITVDAETRTKVDRDTSLVELDLITTATPDAVADLPPSDPEDDSLWSDDIPWSQLEVTLSAESRGFLGLGIVDTTATAWIEDLDGEPVSTVASWRVGDDPISATLVMEDALRTCDAAICRDDYVVVVFFSDENARVKLSADAVLTVDYDRELPAPPIVAMSIAPR